MLLVSITRSDFGDDEGAESIDRGILERPFKSLGVNRLTALALARIVDDNGLNVAVVIQLSAGNEDAVTARSGSRGKLGRRRHPQFRYPDFGNHALPAHQCFGKIRHGLRHEVGRDADAAQASAARTTQNLLKFALIRSSNLAGQRRNMTLRRLHRLGLRDVAASRLIRHLAAGLQTAILERLALASGGATGRGLATILHSQCRVADATGSADEHRAATADDGPAVGRAVVLSPGQLVVDEHHRRAANNGIGNDGTGRRKAHAFVAHHRRRLAVNLHIGAARRHDRVARTRGMRHGPPGEGVCIEQPILSAPIRAASFADMTHCSFSAIDLHGRSIDLHGVLCLDNAVIRLHV